MANRISNGEISIPFTFTGAGGGAVDRPITVSAVVRWVATERPDLGVQHYRTVVTVPIGTAVDNAITTLLNALRTQITAAFTAAGQTTEEGP